jgi:hypothetical protein
MAEVVESTYLASARPRVQMPIAREKKKNWKLKTHTHTLTNGPHAILLLKVLWDPVVINQCYY